MYNENQTKKPVSKSVILTGDDEQQYNLLHQSMIFRSLSKSRINGSNESYISRNNSNHKFEGIHSIFNTEIGKLLNNIRVNGKCKIERGRSLNFDDTNIHLLERIIDEEFNFNTYIKNHYGEYSTIDRISISCDMKKSDINKYNNIICNILFKCFNFTKEEVRIVYSDYESNYSYNNKNIEGYVFLKEGNERAIEVHCGSIFRKIYDKNPQELKKIGIHISQSDPSTYKSIYKHSKLQSLVQCENSDNLFYIVKNK